MNVFVFDIETVPDVESGRKLFDLQGLSDEDTAQAMFNLRRQQVGHEFLAHHLQRIVAISAVFRAGDKVSVWSLGDEDSSEKEIVQRFFDGIEKYTPTLVSWNGSGFDLPVLHYRALLHGIQAPQYWDTGDFNKDFKWNNYISRYHQRHTDLMDLLAMYSGRANAPLDQVATMMGFPGKMGMSGDKVWDAFHNGNIKGIRDYCETDVLNTYLVYLRFELMRGHLNQKSYQIECDLLKEMLKSSNKPPLLEFLEVWEKGEVR